MPMLDDFRERLSRIETKLDMLTSRLFGGDGQQGELEKIDAKFERTDERLVALEQSKAKMQGAYWLACILLASKEVISFFWHKP